MEAERNGNMWWECSECGGQFERSRAPALCCECGTAGVIFVPADIQDPISGVPETDNLRSAWLRAGLEQARAPVAAYV
jgi:hypothetical protein